MNRFLPLALIALTAGAGAGIPTSGLPAGKSDIALHISNETVDQTQIGKALTAAFQPDVDANAVVATLKKELGFELDEDFRDLTAIVNASDDNNFVALVRGKFNKARIEAFATANQVNQRTVRGLKAWNLHDFISAIAKASGNEVGPKDKRETQIVIVDGNTVIIAQPDNLDQAVAAATSGTPWKHEGLSRAAASVQNGWILVSADVASIEAAEAAKRKVPDDASPEAKTAATKRSGAKTVILALGENATDLTLRIRAEFVDEATAKKKVAEAKGLLGFASMATMPGENDSAEEAANKATAADLLRRLSITQAGSAADAKLDYPVQKLAQQLIDAATKRRASAPAGGK